MLFRSMMLWAFSSNFWMFLGGYLLNSTSKVVNVSFWLLATEDSSDAKRPRIFAAIKMIILLAGLLVPAVGFAISAFGTSNTLKVLFVLGSLAMLAHNLIRNALSRETAAGVTAMHAHKDVHLWRGVVNSVGLLRRALAHSGLRPIVLLYALSFVAFQINVFQVIYLSVNLKFSDVIVGFVPAVGAVASVLIFAFVMPRVERKLPLARLTLLASLVAVAGWVAFLFVTRQTPWLLGLSVLLSAAGTFALESYREALVINSVHEIDRAGLYAGVQSVTATVSIPTGILAALLFNGHPLFLFVSIAVLYALTAAFAASTSISASLPESLAPAAAPGPL